MNHQTVVILSLAIFIPAVIGLFRFKKIDPAYYPFIFLVWLGAINELLNDFITSRGISNAINTNIFVLAEAILLLLFFKRMGIFDRNLKLFKAILIFYLIAWFTENFILSSIHSFSSYFIVIFSFFTVLMSISLINIQIGNNKKNLLGSAVFWICIAFILYYTYSVLVEIFWIYGLVATKSFRQSIYRILTYVNLITNLIYALAILWMPRKREYMLL